MTFQHPETFEEYIGNFKPEIRERLIQIRSLVKEAAPDVSEKISYGMPAFTLNGILLYFAAHKKHIGLYPLISAVQEFREELRPYKTAKGSIQFPNNKPLPLKLITAIIEFRVAENRLKSELKKRK